MASNPTEIVHNAPDKRREEIQNGRPSTQPQHVENINNQSNEGNKASGSVVNPNRNSTAASTAASANLGALNAADRKSQQPTAEARSIELAKTKQLQQLDKSISKADKELTKRTTKLEDAYEERWAAAEKANAAHDKTTAAQAAYDDAEINLAIAQGMGVEDDIKKAEANKKQASKDLKKAQEKEEDAYKKFNKTDKKAIEAEQKYDAAKGNLDSLKGERAELDGTASVASGADGNASVSTSQNGTTAAPVRFVMTSDRTDFPLPQQQNQDIPEPTVPEKQVAEMIRAISALNPKSFGNSITNTAWQFNNYLGTVEEPIMIPTVLDLSDYNIGAASESTLGTGDTGTGGTLQGADSLVGDTPYNVSLTGGNGTNSVDGGNAGGTGGTNDGGTGTSTESISGGTGTGTGSVDGGTGESGTDTTGGGSGSTDTAGGGGSSTDTASGGGGGGTSETPGTSGGDSTQGGGTGTGTVTPGTGTGDTGSGGASGGGTSGGGTGTPSTPGTGTGTGGTGNTNAGQVTRVGEPPSHNDPSRITSRTTAAIYSWGGNSQLDWVLLPQPEGAISGGLTQIQEGTMVTTNYDGNMYTRDGFGNPFLNIALNKPGSTCFSINNEGTTKLSRCQYDALKATYERNKFYFDSTGATTFDKAIATENGKKMVNYILRNVNY